MSVGLLEKSVLMHCHSHAMICAFQHRKYDIPTLNKCHDSCSTSYSLLVL